MIGSERAELAHGFFRDGLSALCDYMIGDSCSAGTGIVLA